MWNGKKRREHEEMFLYEDRPGKVSAFEKEFELGRERIIKPAFLV
jgi:hypothetical protein